jgi:hypothetical protein
VEHALQRFAQGVVVFGSPVETGTQAIQALAYGGRLGIGTGADSRRGRPLRKQARGPLHAAGQPGWPAMRPASLPGLRSILGARADWGAGNGDCRGVGRLSAEGGCAAELAPRPHFGTTHGAGPADVRGVCQGCHRRRLRTRSSMSRLRAWVSPDWRRSHSVMRSRSREPQLKLSCSVRVKPSVSTPRRAFQSDCGYRRLEVAGKTQGFVVVPWQGGGDLLERSFGKDVFGGRSGDLVVERTVVVRRRCDAPQGELAQGFTCDVRGLAGVGHFGSARGWGALNHPASCCDAMPLAGSNVRILKENPSGYRRFDRLS